MRLLILGKYPALCAYSILCDYPEYPGNAPSEKGIRPIVWDMVCKNASRALPSELCPFFIQLAVNNLTGQDQSQLFENSDSLPLGFARFIIGSNTPWLHQIAILSTKLCFDPMRKTREELAGHKKGSTKVLKLRLNSSTFITYLSSYTVWPQPIWKKVRTS